MSNVQRPTVQPRALRLCLFLRLLAIFSLTSICPKNTLAAQPMLITASISLRPFALDRDARPARVAGRHFRAALNPILNRTRSG
jgi:hypothetical protein